MWGFVLVRFLFLISHTASRLVMQAGHNRMFTMQSSAVQIIFPPASDGSGIFPPSETEAGRASEITLLSLSHMHRRGNTEKVFCGVKILGGRRPLTNAAGDDSSCRGVGEEKGIER